jgi:capsular exopolysaccharide synthesis family protein
MSDQRRLAALPLHPSAQKSDQSISAYYAPVTQGQEFEPENPGVPLSHYLWILRRNFKKMAAFVAICSFATIIVSSRLQPIYEATATVDVDAQFPSEAIGQEDTGQRDLDSDAFLETQIKLIQSDAVSRPVAEQYHLLNLDARARGNPSEAQRIAEAPVSLGHLRVKRPIGTNLLLISFRSPDPRLSADVANAIAQSYIEKTYALRYQSSSSQAAFLEKHLDELKAKMEQSSLALAQFEKDLDVVNPDEKTNIVSARLIQLNQEYTTAQADRVGKEAAWETVKSGSLPAEQVSSQGDALVKLNDSLDEARQHLALVSATYGTSHPEYKKAASQVAELEKQFEAAREDIRQRVEAQYNQSVNREGMLQKEVNDTKAEWDHLNSRSFEYQQLKHEADENKTLYDELISKIHEADINSGFQNYNISIADHAHPPLHAEFPILWVNLLTAFLASILLAIGAAILQDSLDTTLRDPAEASRFLETDVIGSLPLDRGAAQLPKTSSSASASSILPAAAATNGKRYYRKISDFDEAVRTLRNTIMLSDFEGRLRSIVFTSAVPSEGKTTLVAHLAIANADGGKKTLLVDGDLRRPSLHAKFRLSPREGLSNVLTGELPWQDVVIPIEGKPNLFMIPSGPGSHRAADLIGPRLSTLLDEFAKEYDLVIMDSPPLLGFAEGLQMAAAADGVIIVSRAADTKRKAVAAVISSLNRLRANIIGVVLNQITHTTSADGYAYYGYYHYSRYYNAYNQEHKAEDSTAS